MGKATIVSGGTAGLYTIAYQLDTSAANAKRAKLQALSATLEATDIPAREQLVSDTRAAVTVEEGNFATAVAGYAAGSVTKEQLKTAQTSLTAARGRLQYHTKKLAELKAQLLSLTAEITRINALPTSETRAAWCADYTENLTGTVATIEADGDTRETIIRPGYNGGATWNAARGIAQEARASPSPEQTFYNWAMRTGWQKWRPIYRIATVTAKVGTDPDAKLDIAFDNASAVDHPDGMNLMINYVGALYSVPVIYRNCGSTMFEVGDRVVVEFPSQTWDAADWRVIGFESHPRPCWPYRIKIRDENGNTITPDTLLSREYPASTSRKIQIQLQDVSENNSYTANINNGVLSSNVLFHADTGEFQLKFTPNLVANPDGYFVVVRVGHKVDNQYPNRHLYASWGNNADRSKGGHLVFDMHHFEFGTLSPSSTGTSYTRSVKVWSSIPNYICGHACYTTLSPPDIYLPLGSPADSFYFDFQPVDYQSQTYLANTHYNQIELQDLPSPVTDPTGAVHSSTVYCSTAYYGPEKAQIVKTPYFGEARDIFSYVGGFLTHQPFYFRNSSWSYDY